MLSRDHQRRGRRESGQVVVLFALLLPVILTFGSLVVSAGNWYVLKRHLQTQVDAGALAAGPAFTGCGQDAIATNLKVAQQALRYSGDTLRDGSSYNLQLQDSGDQRVVLNSSGYWKSGDPTDGSTLDSTLGTPCDTKFIDVKATDNRAPLLFRWIPLFPSPKARARVEVHKVVGTNGLKPLGVPEVDPKKVAVIFVNEDAAGGVNSPAAVVGKGWLNRWDPKDPNPLNQPPSQFVGTAAWRTCPTCAGAPDITANFNGSQDYAAYVLATRDVGASLTAGNGSLRDICAQNTTQTHCYGVGTTLQQGISFVHSYSGGGSGSALGAKIRQVELAGGCGTVGSPYESNPYFNVDDGTNCNAILVQANIDFGSSTPLADPTCAQAFANGNAMSWSAGGVGGSNGTWTTTITPNAGSGRNVIDITTKGKKAGGTKTDCSQRDNGTPFPRVAVPYVADDASGVVQYIRLDNVTNGGLANSVNGATIDVHVTVGLTPPLRDAKLTDPPVLLRIGNMPNSQTLRCNGVNPGASGWADAMQNGCPEPYQIYDQSKHEDPGCGNPPSGVPAADPPDCVNSKPGNFQQKVVQDIWGSPCSATPNNWNGVTLPDPSDPRWIALFVMDETAFGSPSDKTYEIRRFAMFYVTAASGLNCPGDDPNPVPGNKNAIYGHFGSYVTPGFGDTIAGDELCSFTDGDLCVSGLVE